MKKRWSSKIIAPSDLDEEVKPYSMDSLSESLHAMSDNGEDDSIITQIEGDKNLSAAEEAYQKGHEAGEKTGREIAEKRLEETINNISRLLEELRDLNRQIYEEAEIKIVALAICIAEKIMHSELKQNPEVIVNVVRASLKKVLDKEMLKIKVNPKDFEVLNRYRPELMISANGRKELTIEWDDSIMPGGCLIETNHGEVDARLDKQLEEISQDLKGEIERNGPRRED